MHACIIHVHVQVTLNLPLLISKTHTVVISATLDTDELFSPVQLIIAPSK